MSRKTLDAVTLMNVLASAAQELLAGSGAWDGVEGLGALVDALEELQDEHVDALEAAADYAVETLGLEITADADALADAQTAAGGFRLAESSLDPEACPGCGCLPGQGLTDGCDHPAGCGFYRENQ